MTSTTGIYCERLIFACNEYLPCEIDNTVRCISIFPAKYRCLCNNGWTG